MSFCRHTESLEIETCCQGNKGEKSAILLATPQTVLSFSPTVLAVSNIQGTNQIIVLYTKSLKVYDTDILARPHPPCESYYS